MSTNKLLLSDTKKKADSSSSYKKERKITRGKQLNLSYSICKDQKYKVKQTKK